MNGSPWNILVVDDSPAMRRMIRRVLDACDISIGSIFEAADGREALAVLEESTVDVVLTDINMPGMNGEQFLSELNDRSERARPPVIVISTDSTRTREVRMIELGAKGYVTKPFFPEQLSAELTRVMCEQVEAE